MAEEGAGAVDPIVALIHVVAAFAPLRDLYPAELLARATPDRARRIAAELAPTLAFLYRLELAAAGRAEGGDAGVVDLVAWRQERGR